MAAPDLPCSDRGFQTAKGTKKFQRWHPPAPIYRLQKDRSRHIPSVKPQCENGWTWKILLTFPILPMPTCPLSDDVAQQEAVRFTLTRLSSHKKLPTLPEIHPFGPFQHHPSKPDPLRLLTPAPSMFTPLRVVSPILFIISVGMEWVVGIKKEIRQTQRNRLTA